MFFTLSNFDLSYDSFPSIPDSVFLNISITVAVISLLMLVIVECLICRTHAPDEVRDGMELTTWDERNKWNVRALQYGMTALVTARASGTGMRDTLPLSFRS